MPRAAKAKTELPIPTPQPATSSVAQPAAQPVIIPAVLQLQDDIVALIRERGQVRQEVMSAQAELATAQAKFQLAQSKLQGLDQEVQYLHQQIATMEGRSVGPVRVPQPTMPMPGSLSGVSSVPTSTYPDDGVNRADAGIFRREM